MTAGGPAGFSLALSHTMSLGISPAFDGGALRVGHLGGNAERGSAQTEAGGKTLRVSMGTMITRRRGWQAEAEAPAA